MAVKMNANRAKIKRAIGDRDGGALTQPETCMSAVRQVELAVYQCRVLRDSPAEGYEIAIA